MLTSVVTSFDIVHVAPVSFDSSGESSHWYCLARVSGSLVSDRITDVALTELSGTKPLLAIQQQALRLSLQRLQAPDAPFDSPARVDDALQWAEREIRDRIDSGDSATLATTRHRCGRHEYVVRMQTTAGAVYFKSGRARARDEGVLTRLLHRLSPHRFPETLALDTAAHHWLYRELAGEPLNGPAFTADRALMAVSALVSVQKQALATPAIHDHLIDREMNATQLLEKVDDAIRDAWRSPGPNADSYGVFHQWCATATADQLQTICHTVDGCGVPLTLTLSDFWTPNVIWTPAASVGFIDLEMSCWSCPMLSLWRFVQDTEQRLGRDSRIRERIYEAFTRGWSEAIAPETMTSLLAQLPLLGSLFTILLFSGSLDSRAAALGAELPPGYRAYQLVPHIQKVLRKVPVSVM